MQKLQEIEIKLKEEASTCDNRNVGYGFIYCENAREKAEILKSVECKDFVLKQAPADSDLIWKNLSRHRGLSFVVGVASIFFCFHLFSDFYPFDAELCNFERV